MQQSESPLTQETEVPWRCNACNSVMDKDPGQFCPVCDRDGTIRPNYEAEVEHLRTLAFDAFLGGYDEGWESRGDDHYWAKPFLRERFRRWLAAHNEED